VFAASTRLGEPQCFTAVLSEDTMLFRSYLEVLLVVEDSACSPESRGSAVLTRFRFRSSIGLLQKRRSRRTNLKDVGADRSIGPPICELTIQWRAGCAQIGRYYVVVRACHVIRKLDQYNCGNGGIAATPRYCLTSSPN